MAGWMAGAWLLWALFFTALVLAVILLAHAVSNRPGAGRDASGRSLVILDERFARGEIDAQEFEERRRALRS